jgi:hypothetical protein
VLAALVVGFAVPFALSQSTVRRQESAEADAA